MGISLPMMGVPGLLDGGAALLFESMSVAITPALGAELIVNGDFGAWTGVAPDDTPDNFTGTGTDATNYVTESAGGGECRFVAAVERQHIGA